MLFFETPHWRWTAHFAAALAWNTLVMSIFGMAIYNLMLDRHGAGRASSGFFVVPGASALMAFVLLNEHLVGHGDRGARRLDRRRRAGVVAAGGPVSAGTFRILLRYPADSRLVTTEDDMTFGKGALLWLIGIPLPIILLLALFWH